MCGFHFVIGERSIEGDKDSCSETVGVIAQLRYVVDAVAGGFSRSEERTADIYGIGTAVDGRDADFFVPGRGEEFKTPHCYLSASSIFLASAPY